MEASPILSSTKEREIDRMMQIGNLALESARKTVQGLEASGIEEFRKNQYGDIVLRGDVEAEAVVLNVLRKSKLEMKVVSEEHGITIIGDNPLCLGILDGLDGSGVYKRERATGRYGTMFAIYKGIDPAYDDYLYGGIIEHVSGKLYFASKEGGSWVIENGAQKRLHCSGSAQLNNKSKLYADTNFDEIYKINVVSVFVKHLKNHDVRCMRSSAIHYIDLSAGNVDAVIEATRKGNLEIAVAFPLIKEAGGVMLCENGQSLGNKKYNEFGQKEHLIVISAATNNLTRDILNRVRYSSMGQH